MVQEGCVGRRMLPGGMGRVVSPSCGPHCCLSAPKTCTRPLTPARDAAGSPTARRMSATATPSAGGTAAAAGITTGTADPVSIPRPWGVWGCCLPHGAHLWGAGRWAAGVCLSAWLCVCVCGPGQPPARVSITLSCFSFRLYTGGEGAEEAADTRGE